MERLSSSFASDNLLAACLDEHNRLDFPFSGYRVVAALQSQSGMIYLGCNYEEGPIEKTLCAERVAVANAFMNCDRGPFKQIGVMAQPQQNPGKLLPPVSPCGICRQVLFEVADLWNQPMGVYMFTDPWQFTGMCGADKHPTAYSPLDNLLPNAFGPSDMAIKDMDKHQRVPANINLGRTPQGSLLKSTPQKPWQTRLIELAEEAAEFSYVPYKGVKEGTAIAFRDPRLPADNEDMNPLRVMLGARIENAAYGATIPSDMVARALARVYLGCNPEVVCEETFTPESA